MDFLAIICMCIYTHVFWLFFPIDFRVLEFAHSPLKAHPYLWSGLQQGVPQAIDPCGARRLLSSLLFFDPMHPCRNGGRVVEVDLSLEKNLTAFPPLTYWQLLHNLL